MDRFRSNHSGPIIASQLFAPREHSLVDLCEHDRSPFHRHAICVSHSPGTTIRRRRMEVIKCHTAVILASIISRNFTDSPSCGRSKNVGSRTIGMSSSSYRQSRDAHQRRPPLVELSPFSSTTAKSSSPASIWRRRSSRSCVQHDPESSACAAVVLDPATADSIKEQSVRTLRKDYVLDVRTELRPLLQAKGFV